MDNVFAELKTTELKGSTFRDKVLNFGDFDISEVVFDVKIKNSFKTLITEQVVAVKNGNILTIPISVLENKTGNFTLELWMTINGVRDLAVKWYITITETSSLSANSNPENVVISFSDEIINVQISQAIVQIGGEVTGVISWDAIDNKPTQFPPENHTHSYNNLTDKPTIPEAVDLSGLQDELVSGENIKTINNQSILGSGNITIESSGGGTAPATTFEPTDNTNASTMKATADYLLENSPVNSMVALSIVNSYLNSAGTAVSSVNWRTSDFINVQLGQQYIYYGRTNTGGVANAIIGYDSSGLFSQVILGINAYYPDGYAFTIPEGVSKIRICTFSDITLKLVLATPVKKIKPSLITEQTLAKDINKSWGAIGHSVWASDGTLQGIQTLVQNKFRFTEYAKYAYSGASLTGGDVNSILFSSRVSQWTAKDIYTYDSITNDFKLNKPIGTQDDFLNNTGYSTYYGALRFLHEKLKTLNPYYMMICANALKRNNASYTSWSANTLGHTLTDYSNALEWVANRLSWRFINQFRDSGINDDNLGVFTSDGIHPNNLGYKRYVDLWINEFEIIYRGT